jgi:hypothetical protein
LFATPALAFEGSKPKNQFKPYVTNLGLIVKAVRSMNNPDGAMEGKMRIGGYQGARSILTAALRVFRDALQHSGMFRPDLMEDVTAAGISACALFDGVEPALPSCCLWLSRRQRVQFQAAISRQ